MLLTCRLESHQLVFNWYICYKKQVDKNITQLPKHEYIQGPQSGSALVSLSAQLVMWHSHDYHMAVKIRAHGKISFLVFGYVPYVSNGYIAP